MLFFLHPAPVSAQQELALGVPVAGSLSGTGNEKYYMVSVAGGQHLFVTLDAADNYNYYDLYIKFGSLPTTVDYDDKGDSPRSDQAVEIASTQAGTYYVMVRSTSGGGNYAIVAHNNSTFPTLTLGTPKAGSLQGTYDIKYYQVSVTAGDHLFAVLDATDNYNYYDLYIKFGSLPTTVDYDNKGDSPRSDQAVEIASTQAGTYYVMVRSTSGGGNYAIVAHNSSTFPTLTLGTPKAGSLQGTYDIKYYQVSVTAGEPLFVILDGENNYDHYDLYIKFGSLPTTVDYDDKGDSPNADQVVGIVSTQAGTYYVMVRSTSGGGDYTIRAQPFRCRISLPVVLRNR
jgi:peptidyl-Asp metalloendopeptidase